VALPRTRRATRWRLGPLGLVGGDRDDDRDGLCDECGGRGTSCICVLDGLSGRTIRVRGGADPGPTPQPSPRQEHHGICDALGVS